MPVKRSQTAADAPAIGSARIPNPRHCEERRDEAIQRHRMIERHIWMASSTAGLPASHSDRGMTNSR
jgi:hypothetical protein